MKVFFFAIPLLTLFVSCQPASPSSITEQKFQALGIEILTAFYNRSAEPDLEKEQAMLARWKNDLEALIATDPNSVWADDAHYLLRIVYVDEPKGEVALLEKMLDQYPAMEFEEWTRKSFDMVIAPGIPMNLDTRIGLAYLYRELGEKEKLRPLILETKAMAPDHPEAFDEYLKEFE